LLGVPISSGMERNLSLEPFKIELRDISVGTELDVIVVGLALLVGLGETEGLPVLLFPAVGTRVSDGERVTLEFDDVGPGEIVGVGVVVVFGLGVVKVAFTIVGADDLKEEGLVDAVGEDEFVIIEGEALELGNRKRSLGSV